jgi:hypothetical protein
MGSVPAFKAPSAGAVVVVFAEAEEAVEDIQKTGIAASSIAGN